MREVAILVVLAGIALPAFAHKPSVTQRVTVQQLEQALAGAHLGGDRRLAKQISDMKLSERLSADRLVRLEKNLRGSQAREALVALADESAFLDLPASEIPAKAEPDSEEKAAMLSRSVDYVKKAIAEWPNFIATRETTRFEGTSMALAADLQDKLFSFDSSRAPTAVKWECPGKPKIGYRRLSMIDRSTVATVYRDGRELHALGEKEGEFACPEHGVSTTEEYSRVLAWVPKIVAHGNVTWSHWEHGVTGLLAVFRYSTLVSYRSTTQVKIHGEIAFDPADGSILRLTQMRHWKKHVPASAGKAPYDATVEYDSAMDYAPVDIGGIACVCPVKRVAIYLAPILWPQGFDSQDDEIYRRLGFPESPLQEYLNDVRFGQYRLYGLP
jgi:hypothetical protein